MITIANVISINEDTNFNGNQQIDPAGIVYVRPNPSDSTQTLLYEEQLGSQPPRRWVIDETLANIVTNTNTDTGYEVLVSSELVSFMDSTENDSFAGETWAINPARIFQMRDADGDDAIVRLNCMNVQGLLEFVFEDTSATISTTANTTITQVESGLVSHINGNPLPNNETIYWSTRLVEKVIPARTGPANYSTPEEVHIATFEAKKIIYTIGTESSS